MIGGLHQEVRRAYMAEGRLFALHLDLLYQCDLDCVHCYLDEKSSRNQDTAFWCGVIDQAADLGVFQLLLSGGELFLRRDVLDIIGHARRRGIYVHVKTHGGHVDDALVRALEALGVSSVGVSYYSTDAEVHDAITRRTGSHAATRSALQRLGRSGLLTVVSIPVMARNAATALATGAECEAWGCQVDISGEIRVSNQGEVGVQADALAAPDRVTLEADLAHQRGGHCQVEAPSTPWPERPHCGAGVTELYVDPEGKVTPCGTWLTSVGDLAAGERLAEIWGKSAGLQTIKAYRQADRPVCGECPLREDCGFCLGQAWLETGDPLAPARTLCKSTWSRAAARARAAGEPEPPLPPGLKGPVFPILTEASCVR